MQDKEVDPITAKGLGDGGSVDRALEHSSLMVPKSVLKKTRSGSSCPAGASFTSRMREGVVLTHRDC